MGRHSGKFGAVDGHTLVGNWVTNHTSSPARSMPSNLQGGTMRRKGIQDWTGSFEQLLGEPTVLPGDQFTFTGYTAPDNDTFNTIGGTYTGTARVDSVNIVWSWREGDPPLLTTVNFSGDGALTPDGTGTIVDSGVALPEIVCNLKVQTGAAGYEADWDNVIQATLNITAGNPRSSNSSSNCWVTSKAGAIDWTLNVVDENDEETLTVGNDYRILLFTTASLFWDLKWGHLEGYSDIRVDRESNDFISKTANFGMMGHDGTAIGAITKPSGTDFWP